MSRQGEVSNLVGSARRSVLGALLSPYTNAFKEFSFRSGKAGATISKAQVFDILRRGVCPGGKQSLVNNSISGVFSNNSSIAGYSVAAVEMLKHMDVTVDADLEFIWSEIVILLASSGDDDDTTTDGGNFRSRKLKSFQMHEKALTQAAAAEAGAFSGEDAPMVDEGEEEHSPPNPALKPAEGGDMEDIKAALESSKKKDNHVVEDNTLELDEADAASAASGVGAGELDDDEESGGTRSAANADTAEIIRRRLAKAGVEPRNDIPVKDLILGFCVAGSPSPTIAAEQCDEIIRIIKEVKSVHDVISRYEFLMLLKEHATTPEIARLDLEELTLYLFPDDVIEVNSLMKLVRSCQLPSKHHGFASKYAAQRLRDWKDARELMFYVPFLILYLGIVLSGKYVTPRTYYGYGATSSVDSLLVTPTFTSCVYDTKDIRNCTQQKQSVTISSLTSRVDWYNYVNSVVIPSMWSTTDNTSTAAATVLGSDFHLVGALKIRNIRVVGESDNTTAFKYFGNVTYGFGTEKRFPSLSKGSIETDVHPNLTPAIVSGYSSAVLPGYDGRVYRTCAELNASGSVLGNIDTFSCDGHAVLIPFNTTYLQASSVLFGIMNGQWIDEETRGVSIEFLAFHPKSTMFIKTQVLAEFHAGGGLSTSVHTSPFSFYTFTSTQPLISGLYVLYFVVLFFNVGRFLLFRLWPLVWSALPRPASSSPVQSTANEEFDRWLLLDIANYAMFCASAISRLIWMSLHSPSDPVYGVDHYPSQYEDAQVYFNTVVVIDSFNILLSVFGLLRFGKFIPAMGLVLAAIERAATDAISLLLVIIGTFLSLVVCAASVFGDQVFGYHSVLWASESLGQVFLQNYDYRPLHDSHPTFSYVFFFSFQIIMSIILLNMFIAVFTDAFGNEMAEAYDPKASAQILDNASQTPLVRSSLWSFFVGSPPVQLTRAILRRLLLLKRCQAQPEVDYLTYDGMLSRCFDLLFTTYDIVSPMPVSSNSGGVDVMNQSSSLIRKDGTGASFASAVSDAKKSFTVEALSQDPWFPVRVDRVHAARVLLALLDKVPIPHVQTPAVSGARAHKGPAATRANKGSSTIFDFINDQVGHDYPLVMTFFVLLPQTLFTISGEYLLDSCMIVYTRWRQNVTKLSLKADDDALLELRLRAVVEERMGLSAAQGSDSTSPFQRAARRMSRVVSMRPPGRDATGDFLARLDQFHRRLFLAMVACSPVMQGAVRSESLQEVVGNVHEVEPKNVGGDSPRKSVKKFTIATAAAAAAADTTTISWETETLSKNSFRALAQICNPLQAAFQESNDEFTSYMNVKHRKLLAEEKKDAGHRWPDPLTVDILVEELEVPDSSAIKWIDFRNHVFDEFGEQALSFGFSVQEYRRIEAYLEKRARFLHLPEHQRPPDNDENDHMTMLRVAAGNLNLADDDDDEADADNGDTNNDRPLGGPLEDVATQEPDAFYVLEESKFKNAWRAARGMMPSDEVLDRVFSIFPKNDQEGGKRLIDMRLFLKYCQENIFAHKNTSFSHHFCEGEKRRLYSVMWIMFYAPVFVLTLFFLFYRSPLGESIWVTKGLTATFAPSGGSSLNDVSSWMSQSVASIWPTPSASATFHNNANYFVGAVRIRQQRNAAESCGQVYLDYFGDPDTGALRFPSWMSNSTATYYSNRVAQDYHMLFKERECYGAWDFGYVQSTLNFLPSSVNGSTLYPEVLAAFAFHEPEISSDTNGFDSKYPSGGFIMQLNYTVAAPYPTDVITQLVNSQWLDNATRAVILEIMVLNFNIGVMARGRFGYEITGSGAFYVIQDVSSTRLTLPVTSLYLVCMVLMWILIVIYIIAFVVSFSRRVSDRMSVYGDGKMFAIVAALFTNFTLLWDLTIILLMIVSFGLRFSSVAGDTFDTVANKGTWPADVSSAIETCKTLQQLEGVNSFFVFLRFLFFIGETNPRFAVVYRTIFAAIVDLATIIGLWIFALFACTLSAAVCFGYGTSEAHSLQSLFFDLFNTASGGNPNYSDYTVSRREAAPVFFCIYFIVCFFVLFNMVVAVLTGKFSDIKNELFSSDVVDRVIKQEALSPVFQTFSSYRWRLHSTLLVQEIKLIYQQFRYCFRVPLRVQCENPRSCWHHMAHAWSTIDAGLPSAVIASSISIMALAKSVEMEQSEHRWDQLKESIEMNKVVNIMKAAAVLNNNSATSPAGSTLRNPTTSTTNNSVATVSFAPNSVHPEDSGSSKSSALLTLVESMKVQRAISSKNTQQSDTVQALTTYADRRLPLWDEYVYYLFDTECAHVSRNLVWLPAVLLRWTQKKLWQHAAEEQHYFDIIRKCYTVDLSESRTSQLVKILPDVEDINIDAIRESKAARKRLRQ